MGLLDGVIGGLVGGEMASVVNGLIERHGGVAGIVAQLERNGLGATVRSWVGTGANQPVTGDELHRALGPATMQDLAARLGLDPQDFSHKLAQVLPQVIDKLTPAGTLPKA